MAISRPVAHDARDHRRSQIGIESRRVCLELGRFMVQGVVRQAGLIRQQDREQLGRMTDPFAEHAEFAGPDRVVVDEAHAVQPAGPVRGGVQGRIGDRVFQGHPIDRGHADRPGHGHDLGPRPIRQQVVVADGRQAEVGAEVGQAEDQRCEPGCGPLGDLSELRGTPAGLDQVRDPNPAGGQPEGCLRVIEEPVDEIHLLRMLDLGDDDAIEGEGDGVVGSEVGIRQLGTLGTLAKSPQQGVQVADRRLEVESRRPVEPQAAGTVLAPIRLDERLGCDGQASSGHLVARRDGVFAIEHDQGGANRTLQSPRHEVARQVQAIGQIVARQAQPLQHPSDRGRPPFDRFACHRRVGGRRRQVRLLAPVAQGQVGPAHGQRRAKCDPPRITVADGARETGVNGLGHGLRS